MLVREGSKIAARVTAYFRYACLYAFHCLLPLCVPPCISLSTFPLLCMYLCISLSTLCMPPRISLFTFPVRIHALHSLLALRVPLRISLLTFPAHASMHLTLYLPHVCLYALHCSEGIGVVDSNMPARPSAGIGVVDVEKLRAFCDSYDARMTLCGDHFCASRASLDPLRDWRGRGAKTRVFCDFCSRYGPV